MQMACSLCNCNCKACLLFGSGVRYRFRRHLEQLPRRASAVTRNPAFFSSDSLHVEVIYANSMGVCVSC